MVEVKTLHRWDVAKEGHMSFMAGSSKHKSRKTWLESQKLGAAEMGLGQ